MKLISLKHLLVGLFMFAAAGMALALKPTAMVSAQSPKIDLETLIPKQFGEWKIDETIAPLIANPEQEALINRIYDQTLSRTYVNARGERIMLSIAYGGDQSDAMQVHKPEACYPAQGFQILKNASDVFSTGDARIPVRRLIATLGPRIEPITYWTTIGDTVAVNGIKWKLQQLKFGLTGKIPDGLLFRVSSIQADEDAAYVAQDDFTRALLRELSPDARKRIIGNAGPTS
ncbi:MAG: EpsI family protein [Thiobacillus sp. GWE1_62_9]|nr:MAG: EpsI family protein [Thiobacillus sp. GWE1_62_9]